jgi:hypothetical protein
MERLLILAIVLTAVGLGGAAACGGEERLSREEFSERLQSIGQRGGELWERLAMVAADLEPDQALPADVKQPMTDLVEFQRQAAAELAELNPPEEAEEEVEMLIEALRDRTEAFEQVIEAGRFTRQDVARVTQSGEKIDESFEQLRNEGFLPQVDEHGTSNG